VHRKWIHGCQKTSFWSLNALFSHTAFGLARCLQDIDSHYDVVDSKKLQELPISVKNTTARPAP